MPVCDDETEAEENHVKEEPELVIEEEMPFNPELEVEVEADVPMVPDDANEQIPSSSTDH